MKAKQPKNSHLLSVSLVTIQFTIIAFLALYGGINRDLLPLMLFAIGVFIGLWAILIMNLRVSIFPEVRSSQELFTSGPYKAIRHPMYTAVLLVTAAMASSRLNAVTIAAWTILLIDLHIKMHYEERLLKQAFTTYKKYMTRTKKLIPYIY